jgi:hypothetical protein
MTGCRLVIRRLARTSAAAGYRVQGSRETQFEQTKDSLRGLRRSAITDNYKDMLRMPIGVAALR